MVIHLKPNIAFIYSGRIDVIEVSRLEKRGVAVPQIYLITVAATATTPSGYSGKGDTEP
jgi:hypothetical protein